MNDGDWVDVALAVTKEEGFETRRVPASPIGEDFSFYQQKIPGAFVMLGSGGGYSMHHLKFNIDDKALFPAAHYFFALAQRALEKLAGPDAGLARH